jgi:hypothetical protein
MIDSDGVMNPFFRHHMVQSDESVSDGQRGIRECCRILSWNLAVLVVHLNQQEFMASSLNPDWPYVNTNELQPVEHGRLRGWSRGFTIYGLSA